MKFGAGDWILYFPQYHAIILGLVLVALIFIVLTWWLARRIYRTLVAILAVLNVITCPCCKSKIVAEVPKLEGAGLVRRLLILLPGHKGVGQASHQPIV